MEVNKIYNVNCFDYMKDLEDKCMDFILTDIPYGKVQRETNGLSQMASLDNLGAANEETFSLNDFLPEIYRLCKNSLVIFCDRTQFSEIFEFFKNKPGTARPIIYNKTNPVPSNGKYVYLNGFELGVWFKRGGAHTFNAFCKNPIFNYPIYGGKKRIHPTQKHPDLFRELIRDNTNEGDIVFDPCAGGATTAMAAYAENRKWICCELNKEFYDKSVEFLKKEIGYIEEQI